MKKKNRIKRIGFVPLLVTLMVLPFIIGASSVHAATKVKLEILSPQGAATKVQIKCAKRLDTLEGKTVALHWNGKPGAEYLLAEIKDQLTAKYRNIKFVEWPKGTAWKDDVKQYMKKYPSDAAVLAVGD